MTRKDYEILADSFGFAIALRRKNSEDKNAWREEMGIYGTIGVMIVGLEKDNARFDREKFTKRIEEKVESYL